MSTFGAHFVLAGVIAGTLSTFSLIEARGVPHHALATEPTAEYSTESRMRTSSTRPIRTRSVREVTEPRNVTEQESTSDAEPIVPDPVPETVPEPVETTDPVSEHADDAPPGEASDDDEVPQPASADERAFLSLHNAARAEVGVPALTWSSALSADATAWAETLADRGCTLDHSGAPYGENIFKQWSNDPDVRGTPEHAVTWWVDEQEYYDHETNTCEPGEVCGHYTQLVWETTTTVGCGAAMCTDDEGYVTDLFVCRYAPIGNIPGQKPY